MRGAPFFFVSLFSPASFIVLFPSFPRRLLSRRYPPFTGLVPHGSRATESFSVTPAGPPVGGYVLTRTPTWGKVVPYRMSGGDWGLRRPRSAECVECITSRLCPSFNHGAEKVGRQVGIETEKEKPAIRQASVQRQAVRSVVIVGVNLRKGMEVEGGLQSVCLGLSV